MEKFPRGKAAIVGAATFGIGEAHGFDAIDIAAHATIKALKSAGLKPSDADALFICLPSDPLSGLSMAQYLGIHPKITDNNRTGGSSFQSHVMWAALALEAGLCDVAVVTYGSVQRTESGKLQNTIKPDPYESLYKPRVPVSAYAMAAARHMHQYGTTREQLAEVAVAARQWANLNPEAFAKGDLSIDDVLGARRISDPLGQYDCCLVTDGAAAIVLTRAERAKDLPNRPVHVLGAAAATFHNQISAMPDLTVTAASSSGPRAFEQAGVKPSDIDVLEVYDAFTINTILFLEDLGFCPKGEGGRFVEGGRIAPGGDIPVNTNGGGLSCVHPGMYGLFTIVEAYQQLAGTAGARQVRDPNLAVAHGNGGFLSSQATLVLGTPETV